MTNRFDGQTAVVAGGARGIGLETALRLAREGSQVCCFDVLNDQLEEAVALAQKESLQLSIMVVDVTDENAVKSSLQACVDQWGRLDVMINCAGITGETSVKIVDSSTEVFDHVMNVNLRAAYFLTKHTIPHMLKRDYGRIMHIASIGGKEGNPGMAAYASSKSGLMGLVKGVGKEYADTGITVNGLAPAVISTPMNLETSQEMLDYMSAKIPMGRLGTTEEAAALICWVVSQEASFNTGFVFDLSGGRATY